jgi:hypothetical protein
MLPELSWCAVVQRAVGTLPLRRARRWLLPSRGVAALPKEDVFGKGPGACEGDERTPISNGRDFGGQLRRQKGETPRRLNRPSPSSAPSATQPPAASPRTAASTPPSESPSFPTATSKPFITTSLPSASRATSPSPSAPAPASSWSSRHSPSQTTSPLSLSSQQPSCNRFVRLHGGSTGFEGRITRRQTARLAYCDSASTSHREVSYC